MALHLLKLCVGCDTIEDLEGWITLRLKEARRAGKEPVHSHVTRMTPKRAEELVDGGSLYWVIRGNVQVRQRILEVRPFRDKEGIQRCGWCWAEDQRDRVATAPSVSGLALSEAREAPRDLETHAPACACCRPSCGAIWRTSGCFNWTLWPL